MMLGVVWTALAFDLRRRRIPNTLTLAAAAVGIAVQSLLGGTGGLLLAVSGLAVGFAVLLPGYLLRATGAGDVKLMAAAGTFLGPFWILIAGLASVFAGAVMAATLAASALVTGSARSPRRRYGLMLNELAATGRVAYAAPAPGEIMGRRFPFAVAIALGTTATLALWWPGLGVFGHG